jgi:hypothetical protein
LVSPVLDMEAKVVTLHSYSFEISFFFILPSTSGIIGHPLSYILMTLIDHLLATLPLFLPVLMTLALVSGGLWGGYWFLFRREGDI